jgi:hypothetical protein
MLALSPRRVSRLEEADLPQQRTRTANSIAITDWKY